MSKHTQGQWKATEVANGFTVEGARYIADVHKWTDGPDSEAAANARLIAAAPEMLEALRHILADFEECEEASPEAVREAKAAIARATGQGGGK